MTEHAPLKVKYDSNSNELGAVLRNLGLEFSTDSGTGLP